MLESFSWDHNLCNRKSDGLHTSITYALNFLQWLALPTNVSAFRASYKVAPLRKMQKETCMEMSFAGPSGHTTTEAHLPLSLLGCVSGVYSTVWRKWRQWTNLPRWCNEITVMPASFGLCWSSAELEYIVRALLSSAVREPPFVCQSCFHFHGPLLTLWGDLRSSMVLSLPLVQVAAKYRLWHYSSIPWSRHNELAMEERSGGWSPTTLRCAWSAALLWRSWIGRKSETWGAPPLLHFAAIAAFRLDLKAIAEDLSVVEEVANYLQPFTCGLRRAARATKKARTEESTTPTRLQKLQQWQWIVRCEWTYLLVGLCQQRWSLQLWRCLRSLMTATIGCNPWVLSCKTSHVQKTRRQPSTSLSKGGTFQQH